MLKMLSPGLRGKLSSMINAPLIRSVPFFKDADEGCIVEIVLLLEPQAWTQQIYTPTVHVHTVRPPVA